MLDQERPDSINPKQIDGKEHDRNQGNDRGVLYLIGSRPRHSTHFGPSVPHKLPGALEKPRPGPGQSTFPPQAFAFRPFTKPGRPWRRSSDGFYDGSIARRGWF